MQIIAFRDQLRSNSNFSHSHTFAIEYENLLVHYSETIDVLKFITQTATICEVYRMKKMSFSRKF